MKVTRLCELADMTPQNYYARRSTWRRQEVDVQLVLELARAERRHQPRLGVRKLYHLIGVELKAAGVKMGRDRLFEELRKAGLLDLGFTFKVVERRVKCVAQDESGSPIEWGWGTA